MVYGEGQGLVGPSRLPLKTPDGMSSHAPVASADLSNMSGGLPFKVNPNKLNIQTNMKQVGEYGLANAQSTFSPFTGMNIQPKSVLN
jgi:hypothetical protein